MAGRGDTADRLTLLRASAIGDPRRAQDDAWAWIKGLGAARDMTRLGQLFELGNVPGPLDGPTEGIPVASQIRILDLPARQLMRHWIPWQGKVFYADAGIGINRLSPSAIAPARVVWPTYRVGRLPTGAVAFEFVTSTGPGSVAPRIPVLRIDYRPVRRNPLAIRRILDELVEVVPHTYLGRVLFRLAGTRFTNIGYFALRQPAVST